MSNITPPGEDVLAQLGIDPTTIKSIKPHWKRTHYRAISNWLTQYQPPSNASNLDKIKGYIEAFYHLCELEDWEKCWTIIYSRLNLINQEELHNQLGIWGYAQEQIKLYEKLIGKVNLEQEGICFTGLGNAHKDLGRYEQAIDYYFKAIDNFKTIVSPQNWAKFVLTWLKKKQGFLSFSSFLAFQRI